MDILNIFKVNILKLLRFVVTLKKYHVVIKLFYSVHFLVDIFSKNVQNSDFYVRLSYLNILINSINFSLCIQIIYIMIIL